MCINISVGVCMRTCKTLSVGGAKRWKEKRKETKKKRKKRRRRRRKRLKENVKKKKKQIEKEKANKLGQFWWKKKAKKWDKKELFVALLGFEEGPHICDLMSLPMFFYSLWFLPCISLLFPYPYLGPITTLNKVLLICVCMCLSGGELDDKQAYGSAFPFEVIWVV